RETPYPLRLFYYALIKAAVGFVHIQRHNRLGACNQLRVAEAYLRPFLPSFLGVQTVLLWQEVGEWLRRLQENLPSWKPLDELPRPRILYTQA
ncbi:MAG: hypothetical protein HYY31_00370, partial [Chloroflexi bacterium]|nr:hypothetical protein [Chloroflexota bacterium]